MFFFLVRPNAIKTIHFILGESDKFINHFGGYKVWEAVSKEFLKKLQSYLDKMQPDVFRHFNTI